MEKAEIWFLSSWNDPVVVEADLYDDYVSSPKPASSDNNMKGV